MKLRLCLILTLILQNVAAQVWKVTSGESDFDGKYVTAVLKGSGGAYPFNSPTLVINRFEENNVNFYITNFGYGGCENNLITLLFDKKRQYTANATLNDEKDIFFFSSFNKDENIALREEVFNEMLSSKRLAIRIENSCYTRDYIFDISGSSVALDRVVGIKNIRSSVQSIKLLEAWEPKLDSLISHIGYPNNAINELTIDKLDRMKFFVQVPYKKFYKTSREEAIIMTDIALSFLQGNSTLEVLNHRGQLVLSSGDTGYTKTGYCFRVNGDSLSILLNTEKAVKEKFIAENLAWIGYPGANVLRRLDIASFDEFKQNFTPDVIYRIGLSIKNVSSNLFYIEPSEYAKTTGVLFYRLSGMNDKLFIKEFPLLYETMEMKRIKEEVRRKMEDSIQVWLNSPDTSLGTLAWEKVDLKPKVSDCLIKTPSDCINELITTKLRSSLGDDLSKYTKPFWVSLIIDYQGRVLVQEVSGLPNKKTVVIRGLLTDLPTLTPPRNAGRVCDVHLDLMVSLI